MLNRSCFEYDIHINWRPLSKSNYGGHIESLLGTFNNDIHVLPGSTSSNIKDRGNYQSEKKAVFTLREFENWLVTYITKVYHEKKHRTINTSPIKKFEEGILGDNENRGCGLPPRISDERKLKLDFLPGAERTVQKYGVAINDIFYFDSQIAKYINYKERGSNLKKKFLVKQNPRDIRTAYFYDDEINDYIDIECTDRAAPSMTLTDLKMVRKILKEKGDKQIDQIKIFQGYEELLQITEKSKKESKSVRRAVQKRKESNKKNENYIPTSNIQDEDKVDIFSLESTGFEDIEYDDD
jgi:putative transposase